GPPMRRVLPLIVLSSLAFAPAPLPRPRPGPSKSDLKKLQGEWHRVRVTIGGSLISEKGNETTIVIADDRMKYAVAGKPTNEWVFALEGKMSPTWFDRKGTKGHANGLTYLGIYRIEADTFT